MLLRKLLLVVLTAAGLFGLKKIADREPRRRERDPARPGRAPAPRPEPTPSREPEPADEAAAAEPEPDDDGAPAESEDPTPGATGGDGDSGVEAAAEEPRTCQATTKSGRSCRREAEPGSEYCWQHAPAS